MNVSAALELCLSQCESVYHQLKMAVAYETDERVQTALADVLKQVNGLYDGLANVRTWVAA